MIYAMHEPMVPGVVTLKVATALARAKLKVVSLCSCTHFPSAPSPITVKAFGE